MRYGAFIDTSGGDSVGIALPLRVHRRRDEPVFGRVRQALGIGLPMTRGDLGALHTFQGQEADIVIEVSGL